jgi:hypothetical protein
VSVREEGESEAAAAEPDLESGSPGEVHVVVRLNTGETAELGVFSDAAAARRGAEAFVARLAGPSVSMWPLVANRYVQPDAIVSVDLIEHGEPRWVGSRRRASWGSPAPRDEGA